MHNFLKIIVTLGFLVIAIKADLPPEIEKCKAAHVNCIARTVEDVLQKYPKGNKEFGLGPVDKFTVNDFTLSESNSNGPVQVKFHFKTADVYGIEKAYINKVIGFEEDLDNSKFEVQATVPLMLIKGQYDAKGRVLLLPLRGEGDADIRLKNVKVTMRVKAVSDFRDGKRYGVIKNARVVLEPENMHVRLENLFNGNKELGDSMNAVINENWKDIWNELGTGINKFVEKIFTGLLRDVLKELPYDDFYKKER